MQFAADLDSLTRSDQWRSLREQSLALRTHTECGTSFAGQQRTETSAQQIDLHGQGFCFGRLSTRRLMGKMHENRKFRWISLGPARSWECSNSLEVLSVRSLGASPSRSSQASICAWER